MGATKQFIIRHSGGAALLLMALALLNSALVGEGLWQGSGLHGYIVQHSRLGGSPHLISVWAAFCQAWAFAGLAGVFACFALWHKHRAPRVETRG